MADLVVDGTNLVLRLSRIEKVGALHGDVRVPLSAVSGVRATATPYEELRGLIRCPGTGWPRLIALGTYRWPGTKAFAAVYRDKPGVVVDLTGVHFQRLVVSTADADDVVGRLMAV